MRVLSVFERVSGFLAVVSAVGAGLAMFVMMIQISLDVAGKYLFNMPIPATLETVSSYYMVAIIFLPLGLVTRDHEHLSVELFTQGLGARQMALVNAVAGVLASCYVGALTLRSFEEAVRATGIRESWETATWDMQVWPSRWAIPIGCGLMLLYMVIHVIDNIAFVSSGRRLMTSGKTKSKLEISQDESAPDSATAEDAKLI